jgi:hypothetical protein
MGWTCTKKASDTLTAISKHCIAETGMSNAFHPFGMKDVQFFFETDNKSYKDGRICGEVWNMKGYQTGTFKINPDGRIVRFAGLPSHFLDKLN